jgi:hypothetical protein
MVYAICIRYNQIKMKRRGKVNTTWSASLAYVIGIFASDGNLSPDKRHLNVTSKDEEIVLRVKSLLKLNNKIGKKARGGSVEKKYYVLQFGDVNFYNFLLSIGLTPAKSKTIGEISIPPAFFADFLRGCMDGDGSIGYNTHPQSRNLQWKIRLCSASPTFLEWIRTRIRTQVGIGGGTIYRLRLKSVNTLSFGKADTRKIIKFMYYKRRLPALERKYISAQECLE